MQFTKISILISAAIAVSACETTQTKPDMTSDGKPLLAELGPPASPLASMETPEHAKVGEKFISFRKGEEQTFEVMESDENSETTLISSGCQYTEPRSVNNYSGLSPSIKWENCGGSTGHAEVTAKGELFPLALGKKVVYSTRGTVTKGSWTGDYTERRVCEVTEQIRIQTPGGEYDTWKIYCKDKNSRRTYYISPELGRTVAFKRKHFKDSSRTYSSVFLRNH